MSIKNIFKFGCLCTALVVVSACAKQKPKPVKKATKKVVKRTLKGDADALYTVKSTHTHNVISAVGVVKPTKQVTILCPSRGVVSEVLVEPGARVEKGQLLLNLDDRLEKQRMAELKTSGKKAAKKVGRLRRKRDDLSEAERLFLDSYKNKIAEYHKLKALIETKKVVSPITGDLSMDIVQVGELYEPSAKLMDVTEMSSVWVDFSLPIKRLGLVGVGRIVKITGEAYPDKVFMGRIKFVDKVVDTVHNVVRLRAECRNPGKLLLPGMTVKLEMKGPTSKNILIPITARFKGPGGPAVFKMTPVGHIVEGKQCFTASKVKVKFGQSVDKGKIEVVSGITEGEFILRNAILDYSNRRFICHLPEALAMAAEEAKELAKAEAAAAKTKGEGASKKLPAKVVLPKKPVKKKTIPMLKKPTTVIRHKIEIPQKKIKKTVESKKKTAIERLKPLHNKLKDSPFIDTDTEAKIVTPL